MNLDEWARTVFGVMEQDGAMAARVKLITPQSGDTWHTWYAPFPDVVDWSVEAESILRGIANQFAGRQQVVFVAETRGGEVIAQLPHAILGKLTSGNLESSSVSTAQTFAAAAATIERITELANRQLDAARRQFDFHTDQQMQQLELLKLYRYRELEGSPDVSPMVQMVQEYAPQVGAVLQLLVENMIEEKRSARSPIVRTPPMQPTKRTVVEDRTVIEHEPAPSDGPAPLDDERRPRRPRRRNGET